MGICTNLVLTFSKCLTIANTQTVRCNFLSTRMSRLNPNLKYALILFTISIYIAFPFFNIKYFETGTTLNIIYNYYLIPVILLAFSTSAIWYFKYLRKLNPPTKSKIKKIAQDFFNLLLGTIFTGGVCLGIVLSTIITTNVYWGTSKQINVEAEVLHYVTGKTKYGRTTHQIEFINPYDNKKIRLEVYREYNVGDIFKKEMKIGYWNQLYSKN